MNVRYVKDQVSSLFVRDNGVKVHNVLFADNMVWLTNNQMSSLFGVSVDKIKACIKLLPSEQVNSATFTLVVWPCGVRCAIDVLHYDLNVVIALGKLLLSDQGELLAKWAEKNWPGCCDEKFQFKVDK